MNHNPIPTLTHLTEEWSDEQFRQLLEEMTGRVAPTTRDECVQALSAALRNQQMTYTIGWAQMTALGLESEGTE